MIMGFPGWWPVAFCLFLFSQNRDALDILYRQFSVGNPVSLAARLVYLKLLHTLCVIIASFPAKSPSKPNHPIFLKPIDI